MSHGTGQAVFIYESWEKFYLTVNNGQMTGRFISVNDGQKNKIKKDRPFYLSVNNGQITDRFISVNDGQKTGHFICG